MTLQQHIHKLYRSSLVLDECLHSIDEIKLFLENERQRIRVKTESIKLEEMTGWSIEKSTGNLKHVSGGFFSIEGIEVKTNWGLKNSWQQPIINQPEIGFLGILAKEFNGIMHFLMQSKIEPGNINFVQLSPTLQATKSNYSRKHKGNSPHYLEYFIDPIKGHGQNIILDQLQSEQGARFLRKRNRNIIITVNKDVEVIPGFIWISLGQIKQLLNEDNLVNMDTRTVISGIPFNACSVKEQQPGSLFGSDMFISATVENKNDSTIEELLSWLTRLKSIYDLWVDKIPLNSVNHWLRNDYKISHVENKYFKVIGLNIEIANREVSNWCQPIIQSAQEGIIGFIIQKRRGVYHFLVQAKIEAGNFDVFELAPTVQCLTGNYRKGQNEYEVPFLGLLLDGENTTVFYKTMQSEEGGRFYKEQNMNIIVGIPEDMELDLPENYAWFTLNQLLTLIKYNNFLNIQARSLISSISFF